MEAQEGNIEEIWATRCISVLPVTGAAQGPRASKELPQSPSAGDEDIRGRTRGSYGQHPSRPWSRLAPGRQPGPHGQSVSAHHRTATPV